jgi:hypothetical protein
VYCSACVDDGDRTKKKFVNIFGKNIAILQMNSFKELILLFLIIKSFSIFKIRKYVADLGH